MTGPTRAPLVLLIALLPALACDGGPAGPADPLAPVVEVEQAAVDRGRSVDLHLGNPGTRTLRYNLCSGAMLQRLDGARWVDTGGTFALCTPILFPLAVGTAVEAEFHVPMGIPTGIHRVAVTFFDDGTPVPAHSNAFVVR
jgi:hypothetical protein